MATYGEAIYGHICANDDGKDIVLGFEVRGWGEVGWWGGGVVGGGESWCAFWMVFGIATHLLCISFLLCFAEIPVSTTNLFPLFPFPFSRFPFFLVSGYFPVGGGGVRWRVMNTYGVNEKIGVKKGVF